LLCEEEKETTSEENQHSVELGRRESGKEKWRWAEKEEERT